MPPKKALDPVVEYPLITNPIGPRFVCSVKLTQDLLDKLHVRLDVSQPHAPVYRGRCGPDQAAQVLGSFRAQENPKSVKITLGGSGTLATNVRLFLERFRPWH